MEGGLFLKDEFINFAKGKILFVSVMSRVKDRANDNLLGKYGLKFFPSFAVLDSDGSKLNVLQHPYTVQKFDRSIVAAKKFKELKAKAAAGDEAAKAELAKIEKTKNLKKLVQSINKVNRVEVTKEIYDAFVEGNRLSLDEADTMYCMIVLQGAIDAKDLKTFDAVSAILNKKAEEDMRMKMVVAQMNLPELRKKISE